MYIFRDHVKNKSVTKAQVTSKTRSEQTKG